MPNYPDRDFPWTFYFNGAAMPKWGANWPDFGPVNYTNWDWEVGPRDFYLINSRIDCLGRVESASPHVFLYAIQELLCLLFTERNTVLKQLRNSARHGATPEEIYHGLVEAAFEMRASTQRDGHAFWTSGYEADRLRLVEVMRRAALPASDPQHVMQPHVKARLRLLDQLWKHQIKTLQGAASSAKIPAEFRKKLQEL